MAERTRAERLRAELDDHLDRDPVGEVLAVWRALTDALWLGALRAALAPEPRATGPWPVPRTHALDTDTPSAERAA